MKRNEIEKKTLAHARRLNVSQSTSRPQQNRGNNDIYICNNSNNICLYIAKQATDIFIYNMHRRQNVPHYFIL